jgi:hypothetical protein
VKEEELYRLYYEARVELARYPGVVGVGLGLRERRGELTEETAFRVYVVEKKSRSDLHPTELIPSRYKGVPTDVLKVREAIETYANENLRSYSRLVGGTNIWNGRSGPRGPLVGTLGFFATIDGLQNPYNVALVTNHHVLAANEGRIGDTVYQPDHSRSLPNNPIATVHRMPTKGHHRYRYPPALWRTPDEPESPYWVDCASAKLDIRVSSLCNTNCGVEFANEIVGLNVAGSNALVDVARARHGETVFKVGWKTGRTEGVVSDVCAPIGQEPDVAYGVLEVTFVRAEYSDVHQFADEGDSGSAIVNDRGQLVGLHYSRGLTRNKSLACNIHPVLQALRVTPITKAHPTPDNPAASGMSRHASVTLDAGSGEVTALRKRVLAVPGGREVLDLIEIHRREVAYLVNHERPVTVAWHRNKGPAFLNRALTNARDPSQRIPEEIEGVSRRQLLESMAAVLAEHGGSELQSALERHARAAIESGARCSDIHELVDDLARARR